MPKSKYARALFEAMDTSKDDQNQGKFTPPKWWKDVEKSKPVESGQDREPAPVPMTQAASAVAKISEAQEAAEPFARIRARMKLWSNRFRAWIRPLDAADGAGPKPHVGSGDLTLPPVIRVQSGRVELSLNPVSASVVVGAILLALLASYQLGRGLAPADRATEYVDAGGVSQDPLAEAMKQKPNSDVLKSPSSLISKRSARSQEDRATQEATIGSRMLPAVVPPTETTERSLARGLNHIVLESFQAEDKDDAEHAQKWFRDKHGIATVLENTGRRWLMISEVGFDYDRKGDETKAGELRDTVRLLGRQYKAAFKGERAIRYDFRSPMIKRFE